MISKLAKAIVCQFIDIIDEMAKCCGVCWDECDFKFTSRKLVDQLVIEVYLRKDDRCRVNPAPIPLVTINFTGVTFETLTTEKWIRYLKKKANQLLKEVQIMNGVLIPVSCYDCCKDVPPINPCDCVYREDFILCETKCCPESPHHFKECCRDPEICCKPKPHCEVPCENITQCWTRKGRDCEWTPVKPPKCHDHHDHHDHHHCGGCPGGAVSATHTVTEVTPNSVSHHTQTVSSSHHSSSSHSHSASHSHGGSHSHGSDHFVCPIHKNCHNHAKHHKICHKINARRD